MASITINNELDNIIQDFNQSLEKVKSFTELNFRTCHLDIDSILSLKEEAESKTSLKDRIEHVLHEEGEFIYNIKEPVIYYFVIKDEINPLELITKLRHGKYNEYKDLTLPYMNKDSEVLNDKGILYVGSRKERFHSRVLEHLGIKINAKTQGLNLLNWNDDTRLKNVEIHYCTFPALSNPAAAAMVLNIIETAVHHHLKPLIGESPYYG